MRVVAVREQIVAEAVRVGEGVEVREQDGDDEGEAEGVLTVADADGVRVALGLTGREMLWVRLRVDRVREREPESVGVRVREGGEWVPEGVQVVDGAWDGVAVRLGLGLGVADGQVGVSVGVGGVGVAVMEGGLLVGLLSEGLGEGVGVGVRPTVTGRDWVGLGVGEWVLDPAAEALAVLDAEGEGEPVGVRERPLGLAVRPRVHVPVRLVLALSEADVVGLRRPEGVEVPVGVRVRLRLAEVLRCAVGLLVRVTLRTADRVWVRVREREGGDGVGESGPVEV